jgi:hypothetical protein
MLLLLKNADTEYLAARVDQQLGSALTRPPFTKDEFMIGMMQLEAYSLSKHGLLYPKLYHIFKKVNNTNGKKHTSSFIQVMKLTFFFFSIRKGRQNLREEPAYGLYSFAFSA